MTPSPIEKVEMWRFDDDWNGGKTPWTSEKPDRSYLERGTFVRADQVVAALNDSLYAPAYDGWLFDFYDEIEALAANLNTSEN